MFCRRSILAFGLVLYLSLLSFGESREDKETPSPTTSAVPSDAPTESPSSTPSARPSVFPSYFPTRGPSSSPSFRPSILPSSEPSAFPTPIRSSSPSSMPSAHPSQTPSAIPTAGPTGLPSLTPTAAPTLSGRPSSTPSAEPSLAPSSSAAPSLNPTISDMPSSTPSDLPSTSPTTSISPSFTPSAGPSFESASPTQSSPPTNTTVDLSTFTLEVQGEVESSFVATLENYFLEGFKYETLVDVRLVQRGRRRLQSSQPLVFDGDATFIGEDVPNDIEERQAALLLDIVGDDLDGVTIVGAALGSPDEEGNESRSAAIAGGVAGGAVALVVLALAILYFSRRRSESEDELVYDGSPVKSQVSRSLDLDPVSAAVEDVNEYMNESADSGISQPPPPSKEELLGQLSFDSSIGVGAVNASTVFRKGKPASLGDPPAARSNLSKGEESMAGYSLGSDAAPTGSEVPDATITPSTFNPYGIQPQRASHISDKQRQKKLDQSRAPKVNQKVLENENLAARPVNDDLVDEPGRIVKQVKATPKKLEGKAESLSAALEDIGTLEKRYEAKQNAQQQAWRSPQAARMAEYLMEKGRSDKAKEPDI